MDKQEITRLTNEIYRITLLFPKKEPLRYKIREVADDILANLITWQVLRNPNPGKLLALGEKKLKELNFGIEKDIEILDSYLAVAENQNWVSSSLILKIKEEYGKITIFPEKERQEGKKSEEEINKELEFRKEAAEEEIDLALSDVGPKKIPFTLEETPEKAEEMSSLDERKKKILEFLKEKQETQVWEVKNIFPGVSKRTLRRDFQKLLNQGLIERLGNRNDTFYRLKREEV